MKKIFCFTDKISFNDEIWKQIDGNSMGSPSGPPLANFYVPKHFPFTKVSFAKEKLLGAGRHPTGRLIPNVPLLFLLLNHSTNHIQHSS